jgi:hypothetical protein
MVGSIGITATLKYLCTTRILLEGIRDEKGFEEEGSSPNFSGDLDESTKDSPP